MADSPLTFSARQTLPDLAPSPVSAVYDTVAKQCTLTFDQHLRPGSVLHTVFDLNVNNFLVSTKGLLFPSPKVITVGCTQSAGPPDASDITYTPPPDVVRNLRLTPGLPFTDYPMSIVP